MTQLLKRIVEFLERRSSYYEVMNLDVALEKWLLCRLPLFHERAFTFIANKQGKINLEKLVRKAKESLELKYSEEFSTLPIKKQMQIEEECHKHIANLLAHYPMLWY